MNAKFRDFFIKFEQKDWNTFVMKAMLVSGLMGALVSIVFNWLGFRNETGESNLLFLSISVFFSIWITINELYLNRRRLSEIWTQTEVGEWILTFGGVVSYTYGIYTNVVGMCLMILHKGDLIAVGKENPLLLIIPVVLGIFLEVAPEPSIQVWMRYRRSMMKEEKQSERDRVRQERDEERQRQRELAQERQDRHSNAPPAPQKTLYHTLPRAREFSESRDDGRH